MSLDLHRSQFLVALAAALSWPVAGRAADAPAPRPSPAAQEAAKKGNTLSLSGKASQGQRLTRDQLRECLSQQPVLKAQGSDAQRAQEQLDASKKDLARVDAELETERTAVDATNAAAVDAFNVKLQGWRERAEAYNVQLAAANDQADAYNAAQQKWTTDCADRPYDEADYFAIQRGK